MNRNYGPSSDTTQGAFSRRALLRGGGRMLGGALLSHMLQTREALNAAATVEAAAQNDPVETMREFLGKAPINVTKVAESLYMLSGPGGNIGVSVGQD